MQAWRIAVCLSVLLFCIAPLPGCAQEAPLDVEKIHRQAQQAFRSGQYKAARPLYQKLAEAADTSGGSYLLHYFETFASTGEYGEGLRRLANMLEEEPDNPYLLHIRGQLFTDVGRYDEAEAAFRRARRLRPGFWRNTFELGRLLERTGRSQQAADLYADIYRTYQQGQFSTADLIGLAGAAASHLEQFHEANRAFRTAYQMDPSHVQSLYWWGELFRTKYNEADARRTYKEALSVNPRHTDLLVGYAQSLGSFDQQEELLQKALRINPNSVPALNKLAELRIQDGLYSEAQELLGRALDVNPNSVPSLAHLASVHYLEEHTSAFEETEQHALNVDPRAGNFYVTLAENCARRFRYPAAVRFSRRAVQVDAGSASTLASFGINLLRLGEARNARRYLSASFERDPFNLFVGNTLTLIDEYENFDTLQAEHVQVLIHKSDRDVLGPSLLKAAQAAYDSLSARYPYAPSNTIQIESYNDPNDFSVRVAGVPHVGLLGVSFGDIVALQTPQPDTDSPQNWARTLWHELAHTMAIGVSDYHVPRWFTEGLSVYEEQRARPDWGREMDLQLFTALDQDRLLPLSKIGSGFTRPSFPGQVMLSYYHASKVISFIAEEYGFEAIIEILATLRQGHDINRALRTVVKKDLEALESAFRSHLLEKRNELEDVLPPMSDPLDAKGNLDKEGESPFFQHLRAGQAALEAKQYANAEERFKAALDLYPRYVASGNPYEGLAAVYRKRNDQAQLMSILERYLQFSDYGAEEARTLGALHRQVGNPARAVIYLERSLEVAPHHRGTHRRLAELHDELGQYPRAVQARRAVLALEPVDEAQSYYELARSLYKNGQFQEAKHTVLQSLERAPGYRAAQKLLLRCIARQS